MTQVDPKPPDTLSEQGFYGLYYFWEPVIVVGSLGGGWLTCAHEDGRPWTHWYEDLRTEPMEKLWNVAR